MDSEAVSLYKNLPLAINRKDPIIGALLADETGHGGVGNEITAVKEFIKYISRVDYYMDLQGEELIGLVRLMTGMIKRSSDTDKEYLKLFTAIIQRGGAKVFGTKTDILNALRYYLNPDIKIDLIENTGGSNLILNPDFATEENFWMLDGFCVLTPNAAFTNKLGASLYGIGGSISQTFLSDQAGIYVVHIFMRGKCAVQIVNDSGEYWNSETFDWQTEQTDTLIENGTIDDAFKNKYMFFRHKTDYTDLTVSFIYSGIEGHVDHIMVYKKPKNPSYSLLLIYPGELITRTTLNLDKTYHPDGDPNPDDNYEERGYFDNSPIIGKRLQSTIAVYKYLLEFMNPCGVQYSFDEVLELERPIDIIPFISLRADGDLRNITTKLTVILGADVLDGVGEIALVSGDTGAVIAGFTNKGRGKYEIALTGIIKSGLVGVTIKHMGVTPASKTVGIIYAQTVAFTALGVDGWEVEFNRIIADGFEPEFESVTADGWEVDFKKLEANVDYEELGADGFVIEFKKLEENGHDVDFKSVTTDGWEVDYEDAGAEGFSVDFNAVSANGWNVDFEDLTSDGFSE